MRQNMNLQGIRYGTDVSGKTNRITEKGVSDKIQRRGKETDVGFVIQEEQTSTQHGDAY